MLNIPYETIFYCESLGLEAWSTGGGCDYVGCTDRESGISFQISDKAIDRADELDNPAEMFVFDGLDYQIHLMMEFSTTKAALDAAGSTDFRSLALRLFSKEMSAISKERAVRIKQFSVIGDELEAALSAVSIEEYIARHYGVLGCHFHTIEGLEVEHLPGIKIF